MRFYEVQKVFYFPTVYKVTCNIPEMRSGFRNNQNKQCKKQCTNLMTHPKCVYTNFRQEKQVDERHLGTYPTPTNYVIQIDPINVVA